MSKDIMAAWDRIESWLKVSAPNSYASLRPPAIPEQLAAAQARMGISWPEELAALWLLHDGAEAFEVEGDEEGEVNPAKFLVGYTFLPLDECARVHAPRSDSETGTVGFAGWAPVTGADDIGSALRMPAGVGSFHRAARSTAEAAVREPGPATSDRPTVKETSAASNSTAGTATWARLRLGRARPGCAFSTRVSFLDRSSRMITEGL
ncbi:hypothetical protein ACFRAO_02280 [Streptomyces sp. NPDC056656]|uniref:hypothetical protein n=1 Tax=Streptomyces sp. NPDC056656 TaxID=3345895 RepID=UPI0036A6AFC8